MLLLDPTPLTQLFSYLLTHDQVILASLVATLSAPLYRLINALSVYWETRLKAKGRVAQKEEELKLKREQLEYEQMKIRTTNEFNVLQGS